MQTLITIQVYSTQLEVIFSDVFRIHCPIDGGSYFVRDNRLILVDSVGNFERVAPFAKFELCTLCPSVNIPSSINFGKTNTS